MKLPFVTRRHHDAEVESLRAENAMLVDTVVGAASRIREVIREGRVAQDYAVEQYMKLHAAHVRLAAEKTPSPVCGCEIYEVCRVCDPAAFRRLTPKEK